MSIGTKLAGFSAIMKFDNWMELVFTRTAFRRDQMIYVFRGLSFIVDHAGGDANGVRACLASPMYRQFMSHIDFDGEVALLDIGANGGGFPLLLRSLGVSFSRFVSVEMNPNTWSRLVFNVANNFPNGEGIALNLAVAGQAGQQAIRFGRGSTGDSLLLDDCRPKSEGQRFVQLETLDTIANTHFPAQMIDLCKMDIEGAEFDVLMSDACESLRRTKYLLIEIHPLRFGPKRLPSLIERIASLGFGEISCSDEDETSIHLYRNQAMSFWRS